MTPFSATVRSEFTKLLALRSTKIQIVLAMLLGVAMSGLLAWILGMTYDDWDAAGRSDFEPIGASLIGGILSAIFFLVIGVKAATGEYSSGMIRLTLTATPQRWRVLAAKAIAVCSVMLATGLVLTVAMFLVAQTIFASYGMKSASLTDGDALRAVLGNGLLSWQFPLIAMTLGFMLRSTAGAVLGVLAVIFVPPFAGGLLPAWFADHVAMYLPGAASDAIAIGHLEESGDALLAPGFGVLVVLAWTAIFLGVAWAVFERRDG
jgi:ABC-2 type transport system permease protein